MPLQAQRTLVKSQPELWAEVSDAAALAKHLGELGEIRITRVEAERTVAWEATGAAGTVDLEPSGWGTRVTITASRPANAEAAPPPAEAPAPVPPPTLADAVAALMASAPDAGPPPGDEAITEENPVVTAALLAETLPSRSRWWAPWRRRAPAAERNGGPPAAEPTVPAAAEEPPGEPSPRLAHVPEPEAVRVPEPPPEPEDPELLEVLTSVLDSLGTAHHRPYSRP